MNEQDIFTKEIIKYPDRWENYLVFADWLEDDQQPILSYAYRWMANRKKRPNYRQYHYGVARKIVRVATKYSWAWYPDWIPDYLIKNKSIPKSSLLPPLVFLSTGHHSNQRFFGSYDDAIDALAKGLDKLRSAYELDLDKV